MTKTNEPLLYYKWLWRDWRADRRVQKLTYITQGLYRSLLDEQWCEGGLPTSVEDLSDICGCPVEVMQENWIALSKFFEETEPGVLVNSKLEKQRTAQDLVRAAKSRGGKASALQKLSKSQHMLTPGEDSLVSVAESHIAEQSRADTEQSTSEQDAADSYEGEDTDMSKISKEIQTACGGRSRVYPQQDEQLKALEVEHSRSAVVTDFKAFLRENDGDDFRYGPVSAYLNVASDRLSTDTTAAVASAKDPEVVSLARELTYASGGEIAFQDKQRSRLAEVLKEFSAEEIKHAFATWLGNQDLSDPKNVSFLAGKFVQIADSLCYTAKRKKQESEETKVLRDQTATRLQEQAEQERLAKAQQEKILDSFDPLAD